MKSRTKMTEKCSLSILSFMCNTIFRSYQNTTGTLHMYVITIIMSCRPTATVTDSQKMTDDHH